MSWIIGLVLCCTFYAVSAADDMRINIFTTITNDDFGTMSYDEFKTWPLFSTDVRPSIPEWIITDREQYTLNGSYSIFEYAPRGSEYYVAYSEGCTGNIAVGENRTCIITNDDPEPPIHEGDWCYQESAKEATECGGLTTGTYSSQGLWNDGDWNYSHPMQVNGTYTVNYSKPSDALSTSVFKLKFRSVTGDDIDSFTSTESFYILPDSCFAQPSLMFRLNLPPENSVAQCWNGNEWRDLGLLHDGLALEVGHIALIEEAMLWDMPSNNTNSIDENSTGSIRSYYAQGFATNDVQGYLVQVLWLRTFGDPQKYGNAGAGQLQINTGKESVQYTLVKFPSKPGEIVFEVHSHDPDVSIGTFMLVKESKSDVSIWRGDLNLTSGVYTRDYDVELGSRSAVAQDIPHINKLFTETQRFNWQDSFVSRILRWLFG